MVKINREKTIFDVLYSKQAFLNNKNIGFKNPQNWHFCKGVSPWFWSKIVNFVNVSFLVHRFGQKFEISSTLIFVQNRLRESIWERSS